MNSHKNARLDADRATPDGPSPGGGEPVAVLAQAIPLSARRVREWWRRYRVEGEAGLQDRSSRPYRSPGALPRYRRRQIVRLRHQQKSSLEIAAALRLPLPTVVHLQRELGLARLTVLDPKPPLVR